MKTLTNDFITEKNKQESAGLINLYEVEYQTDTWLYFAQWDTDIVFNGNTYTKFPISHDKSGENREGNIEQVSVRVANVDRAIGAYVEDYDGLLGLRINILTVFETILDDPTARLIERYTIDSCTINQGAVTFICTGVLDVMNVVLPSRRFLPICQWIFKGTECGYSGAETECNKTLTRCRELNNSERWGGFRVTSIRRFFF